MTAINVVPKTVTLVPARTTEVSNITWRTLDDSFNRRLRIQVNGVITITVEAADYDALGQWTDETVKQIILNRLQLSEAVVP
jgi:hypothetical protein